MYLCRHLFFSSLSQGLCPESQYIDQAGLKLTASVCHLGAGIKTESQPHLACVSLEVDSAHGVRVLMVALGRDRSFPVTSSLKYGGRGEVVVSSGE